MLPPWLAERPPPLVTWPARDTWSMRYERAAIDDNALDAPTVAPSPRRREPADLRVSHSYLLCLLSLTFVPSEPRRLYALRVNAFVKIRARARSPIPDSDPIRFSSNRSARTSRYSRFARFSRLISHTCHTSAFVTDDGLSDDCGEE